MTSGASFSPSAMYGRLATITSKSMFRPFSPFPPSGAESASSACGSVFSWGMLANRFVWMVETLAPSRMAFSRARSRACGEMSASTTSPARSLSSSASVTPITPEPVPMSRMRTGWSGIFFNTISTSSSVSGRGIRARASVRKSLRKNSVTPSRCCSGSPAALRFSSSRRGASSASSTGLSNWE